MHLTKKELRRHFQAIRKDLSQKCIQNWSQQIVSQILQLPIYQTAKKVGIYNPVSTEVQIQPLMEQPKEIYLPVVQQDLHLEFYLYDKQQTMIKNKWQIGEPSTQQAHINIQNLDIMFLPMLAFDIHGHRLGMGQGCYDRTLTNQQIFKIGIAFDIQEYISIPYDKHDVVMNMIITEKRILTF